MNLNPKRYSGFCKPYKNRDHCAVYPSTNIYPMRTRQYGCPEGDSQHVLAKYETICGEIITEFLRFPGRSPTFCSHYLYSFGALPGRRLRAVRTRQRIPNSENKCLRSSFCGVQGLATLYEQQETLWAERLFKFLHLQHAISSSSELRASRYLPHSLIWCATIYQVCGITRQYLADGEKVVVFPSKRSKREVPYPVAPYLVVSSHMAGPRSNKIRSLDLSNLLQRIYK